jgi:hypothetical protein
MRAQRIVSASVLCLILVCLLGGKKLGGPEVDPAVLDLKDGDVVFQHLTGKLGSVIAEVTESPLTHCGMVVHRRGEPYVIEAIGPVRYIAFKKWVAQGDQGHFSQMRLKSASEEQIAKTVTAAETLLGLPYDIQYDFDDEKIYCSELVYKAYLRGGEIEVGSKEALRDLNWKGSEKFIRVLAGGELPLDRQMVTPVSISRDPKFKLMYSTFPPRKSEPRYDRAALAGRWTGDYTIKDLVPAKASLEFDSQGEFVAGTIQLAEGTTVPISSLDVTPFKSQREFTAQLRDARGIRGDIEARLRDEGRCILGTWRDDLGNRGVFSIAKD